MSKEMRIDTESIEQYIDSERNRLVFVMPAQFTTKTYLNHFGIVQSICNNGKNKKLYIQFDFRKTTWADPTALISLLLLASELKLKQDKTISIQMPRKTIVPEAEPFIKEREKPNPFYSFLYAHEFVDVLLDYCVVIDEDIMLTKVHLTEDRTKHTSLLVFPDSYLHSPAVLDLGYYFQEGKSLGEWINSYLNACQHRIKKIVPDFHFKSTYNSIFLFLFETLHNVYDHAYPHEATRLAGIYIRYRNGLTNHTLTSGNIAAISSVLSKEQANSPRLFRSFADQCGGFIEIFVCDAGIGIAKSFSNAYPEEGKRPFRRVLDDVINVGKRNPVKPIHTKFGGLYVLSKIIKKGFIWIVDRTECFGESLPIKAKIGDTEEVPFSSEPIRGLTMMARITWAVDVSDNPDWFRPFNGRDFSNSFLEKCLIEKVNIYQKYFIKSYKEFRQNPFYVRDERFGNSDSLPVGYSKNGSSINHILFLPPEGLSKFDIYRCVSEEFNDVVNPSQTLIIGDISNDEANLYQFALDGAQFQQRFGTKFSRIILVTRDYSVMVLERHKDRTGLYEFRINKAAAASYCANPSETFDPSNSLFHFTEWLKTHDSMLFWMDLFNKGDEEQYFMQGSISWLKGQKEVVLKSYFNFSQTLTNAHSLDLYSLCLARILCVNKESYYYGLDILTKNLTDSFNLENRLYEQNGHKIVVGSVYVTGATYDDIAPRIENNLFVNYFYNPPIDVELAETVLHFFLWPDSNFLNLHSHETTQNHQRVGSSAVIAPYGWKYFTIPRYKNKNTPEKTIHDIVNIEGQGADSADFISISECNPPDTYRYWQSPNVLSIGHYEYTNYHDLFKIDLPFAFDESWKLSDELSTFILLEFIVSLDIPVTQLNVSEDLREKLTQKIRNREMASAEKVDIVVYPYHFSTEHVMRTIKGCIPSAYQNKIISLIPINNNTSQTPYFISPQTENKIRNVIKSRIDEKNESPLNCLLFDTLKISGKLERELKHILKLCGINNIKTFTVVDRQRLPIHSFESKHFWKFDVPNLGSKSTCPICGVLNKVSNLKNALASELMVSRLDTWGQAWGKIFRYSSDVQTHGIRPTEISLRNEGKKKFSIYVNNEGEAIQIGGRGNEITLNRSIGLTVYCAEMLAMTTKDDIALDVIDKENLQAEAIIEIVSVNLLLYHTLMSIGTKRKLLRMLFDICKNKLEANNHTILAGLTLCVIEEFDSKEILTWCVKEGTAYLDVMNIDILLALTFKADFNENSPLRNLTELKRLIKSNATEKEINKLYHSGLYNDYGEAHDTPLHKIEKGHRLTKPTLLDANNSLRHLNSLLSNFHLSDFATSDSSIDLVENMESANVHLDELNEKVKRYYYMTETDFTILEQSIFSDVKPNISFVTSVYKFIHNNLFASFNLQDAGFDLKDKINIVRMSFLEKYQIHFSNCFIKPVVESLSVVDRWVPWNSKIKSVVRDILDNCKYVEEEIHDPCPKSTSNLMAKMWISTEFDAKNYYLCFINKAKMTASEVKFETVKKFKAGEDYINNIGGEIRYEDIEVKVNGIETTYLKTIIKLPYV